MFFGSDVFSFSNFYFWVSFCNLKPFDAAPVRYVALSSKAKLDMVLTEAFNNCISGEFRESDSTKFECCS